MLCSVHIGVHKISKKKYHKFSNEIFIVLIKQIYFFFQFFQNFDWRYCLLWKNKSAKEEISIQYFNVFMFQITFIFLNVIYEFLILLINKSPWASMLNWEIWSIMCILMLKKFDWLVFNTNFSSISAILWQLSPTLWVVEILVCY